jgi:hypothetical protein
MVKVLISAFRLQRTLVFFSQMMQSIDFRITFVKPFFKKYIFLFWFTAVEEKNTW